MTRAPKTLLSCLAIAALLPVMACGQGALPAPKPAPQADIETRATPMKQKHDLPRLLAPPPAYGNKIVMAQLESRNRAN